MANGCPRCAEYLARRGRVLGPAISDHARKTGQDVEVVIVGYMNGVHERHLAGLPL